MYAALKKIILTVTVIPVSFFLRITGWFYNIWGRVYYTASLISKIKSWDTSIQCDGNIQVTGTIKVHIGERCRIGKDTELRTMEQGAIHLSDDIRINRGCTITSYSNVSIGSFTIIGEYTSIRDANHGMKKNEPIRFQPHVSAPIQIGKDVWIGRGCCILPGVSIGDGAVIGANSVVTKDVPPYVVAAGIPAIRIKER
jgi:acetyltransferase-like isoleucine patch superfamily enzyme